MEEVLSKHANIGEKLFLHLDYEDLKTSRLVSKSWNHFIVNQKFFWFKKLKRIAKELHNKNYYESPKLWKQIFEKIPTKTVIDFVQNVEYSHSIWETSVFDTHLHLILRNIKLFNRIDLITIATNIVKNHTGKVPLHVYQILEKHRKNI